MNKMDVRNKLNNVLFHNKKNDGDIYEVDINFISTEIVSLSDDGSLLSNLLASHNGDNELILKQCEIILKPYSLSFMDNDLVITNNQFSIENIEEEGLKFINGLKAIEAYF